MLNPDPDVKARPQFHGFPERWMLFYLIKRGWPWLISDDHGTKKRSHLTITRSIWRYDDRLAYPMKKAKKRPRQIENSGMRYPSPM